MKAMVLLSGGLDSCTAAAMAKADGHDLHALTIDYGQRHGRELQAAAAVAAALDVPQLVLRVPLDRLGGSALTDPALAVPDASEAARDAAGGPADDRDRGTATAPGAHSIPVTYVPARNTVFLSLALAYAETLDARSIYIGANAIDYSGYPDCRPEYIAAFQRLADLATKAGVEGRGPRIEAPLLHMTKQQIVEAAVRAGAPIDRTWSCYRGGTAACGTCDSCRLRRAGFAAAGVDDPIAYEVA